MKTLAQYTVQLSQFIVKVCEAIITKLDPVRVSKCRFTTKEVSMNFKGYLPPKTWVKIGYTVSAYIRRSEDETEAHFAEMEMFVDGDAKEKKVAQLELTYPGAMSVGLDTPPPSV